METGIAEISYFTCLSQLSVRYNGYRSTWHPFRNLSSELTENWRVYWLGSSSYRGHENLCSFESLTPRFLRRVYGFRGAGVSPAEVDHQVQLPRPATALREKHHTAGKKTFRI